ncbi:MAG: 3-deoxy-D-manno-octulosonic acid transferase [Candidatus Aminicenantes bacterium]|nr:3-deoxy-D-manno-octulosonic acid transferase [Candidatus Aminicenantes bacterium]
MFVLYSFLLFFAMLVYYPVYYIKLRIIRRESLHLKKRMGFGLQKSERKGKSLWIHAVSVGEVLSLRNLILKLREKHPDWVIRLSTLTQTGFKMAGEKLRGLDDIFYVPLDFRWSVRRFFKVLEPDLFILAESEFWPNLLRAAKKWTGGVLLINGRISPRSAGRYHKYRYFVAKILRNIDFCLVQTERDKEILENLHMDKSCIEVSGNLKTDIALPLYTDGEIESFKREMNIPSSHCVLVAGSTHKGEEERLLAAYVEAKTRRPDILLILAPRHLDRVGEVELLCVKSGLKVARRTSLGPGTSWEVLVLDTLGELTRFYAVSDISFVGGSLVSRGGQNLLEPAFYSKPVFFGPRMDNFAFFADTFVKSHGARIVESQEDLVRMFLLMDSDTLSEMGSKARGLLTSLQGATDKTIAQIESMMGE